MRTKEDIEKDLASARAAYNSMANLPVEPGTSGQAKGMFLNNCARKIDELLEELKALEADGLIS